MLSSNKLVQPAQKLCLLEKAKKKKKKDVDQLSKYRSKPFSLDMEIVKTETFAILIGFKCVSYTLVPVVCVIHTLQNFVFKKPIKTSLENFAGFSGDIVSCFCEPVALQEIVKNPLLLKFIVKSSQEVVKIYSKFSRLLLSFYSQSY